MAVLLSVCRALWLCSVSTVCLPQGGPGHDTNRQPPQAFVACGAGYDGCLRGMSLAEATRDMRKYSGALVFNYDVEGLTDMVSTSRVLLLVTAPHQLESTRLMAHRDF